MEARAEPEGSTMAEKTLLLQAVYVSLTNVTSHFVEIQGDGLFCPFFRQESKSRRFVSSESRKMPLANKVIHKFGG
jgi:hypothetical protein